MAAILKLMLTIAMTMAITIALTMNNSRNRSPLLHQETPKNDETLITLPRKRASRFLAQDKRPRNPNAADHCHKNPEICGYQGRNSTTCCNNKCVDLTYDSQNCGACKNKCKFSQVCCRGECVYLAYDKRHCGECNHRCELGEFCVYGMCSYA